jgi:hypothetical protein
MEIRFVSSRSDIAILNRFPNSAQWLNRVPTIAEFTSLSIESDIWKIEGYRGSKQVG